LDVIFTDKNRQDLGVLRDFSLDVDVAGERDFEIKVPLNHTGLVVGGYIYIEGQEYGGKIDRIKVDTVNEELIYSGRNWRGMLASKVVSPPAGQAYRYLTGTWADVMTALFDELGLSALFKADPASLEVKDWKVDRYVTLLSMIDKLLEDNGRRVDLKWSGEDERVLVGAVPIRDLTDSVQYETGDAVQLVVEDNRGGVNHLICLGQGELTAREVVHLYCTPTGGITEAKQYYTGLDEVVDVYENTGAEDRAALKSGGFSRLKELKNAQTFSATVQDYDVQIGDIVGGVERITGIRVAEPVTNIIFKIDGDGVASIEYKVGEST
jgi:hypothetical protein